MQHNNSEQKKIFLNSEIKKYNIFTWVKDKKFRFISCSENLSELAGADSPTNMFGKDDFSLIWKNDAEYFRKKDMEIIKNEIQYINVVEMIDVVTNEGIHKQPILITKSPLFNRKGQCIGIAGSHLNLPDYQTAGDQSKKNDGRLWLPKELGNVYLTKKEVSVLKYILLGKTSKQIGKILNLSFRTVEEYTNKLKQKLQCSYKHEIHSVAIEYGITYLLC